MRCTFLFLFFIGGVSATGQLVARSSSCSETCWLVGHETTPDMRTLRAATLMGFEFLQTSPASVAITYGRADGRIHVSANGLECLSWGLVMRILSVSPIHPI